MDEEDLLSLILDELRALRCEVAELRAMAGPLRLSASVQCDGCRKAAGGAVMLVGRGGVAVDSIAVEPSVTEYAAAVGVCWLCGGLDGEHDDDCPMSPDDEAVDRAASCDLCGAPAEAGRGRNGLDHLCGGCAEGLPDG